MRGYVSYRPGQAHLSWERDSGRVNVMRSEAPHEGFEKVGEVDLEKGEYIDEYPITENNLMYYRLDLDLLYPHAIPNRYAREIMRRDHWFLRSHHYSGANHGFLLMARTRGDKCPECWDSIEKRPERSNCPNCYGRGIDNPFFSPLKIYFDFNMHNNNRRVSENYTTVNMQRQQIWTGGFPIIKPNDLIEYKGTLYRVDNNTVYTRLGDFVTKQRLPLRALEYNRPEYEIPLPPLKRYQRISEEMLGGRDLET